MKFWVYMIKKIWGLVNMHYHLQNNYDIFLKHFFNWYLFLDLDFDKIQSFIQIILFNKFIYY